MQGGGVRRSHVVCIMALMVLCATILAISDSNRQYYLTNMIQVHGKALKQFILCLKNANKDPFPLW